MESVTYDKTNDHCCYLNSLSDSQHRFRKSRFAITNLLELTDDIKQSLDGGNTIDLIFVDFSKAFDKISHYKLLYKLTKFGISGYIHNCIKCFLKDITFSVNINSCHSVSHEVTSSVPQGSKL